MSTQITKQEAAALYAAVFDRAPDYAGLEYWTTDASEGDFKQMANDFTENAVFTDTYGEMDNEEFVKAIYENVLLTAGDEAGIDYWVDQLNDNEDMTRGDFIAEFLIAALEYDGDDADGLKRKQAIENRAEVGIDYAEKLGENSNIPADAENIEETEQYKQSVDALDGVDDSEDSVTAAKDKISAMAADANSKTFTLTTGIDNLTGTDGNDTFDAPVEVNQYTDDIKNTLNSGDQIDGGGGYNKLNATIGVGAGAAITPVLSNVQEVNIKSVVASQKLDLQSSTGVEQINIDAVVAGTNVTGVQDANVSVSKLKGGKEVDLQGIEGKDFTLGVNAVGSKKDDIVTAADVKLGVDAATKTLTIDAVGNNYLEETGLVATALTGLKVTGAGSLDLSFTNAQTGLTSVDATANAGGLTADFSAATNKLTSLKTGAGDDDITVAVGALVKDNVIDLGAGNNTLTAISTSNIDLSAIKLGGKDGVSLSGVDTLGLKGGFTASALELKDSGLSGLVLDGALAGATTLQNAAKDFTLGLKSSSVAGSLTLAKGTDGIATETLTLNVDSGTATTLVNLVASDAKTLTVNAASKTTLTELTAGKLTNLTLADTSEDGDEAITVTEFAANEIKTINLNGQVTLDDEGAVTEGTTFDIAFAAFTADAKTTNAITVNLGEFKELDYDAKNTATISETFKFTSGDFKKVDITDFTAGYANGDTLDLSALGVTGKADLKFVETGAIGSKVTTITAADGQFAGEIVLTGTVEADLLADNFIFA